MLIAFSKCKNQTVFSMTDSMNFGPDWIRNLSSEGTTGGGGTNTTGTRYQLADYRYGREEMLALFDRNIKPPACVANFKSLYSETTLPPLALIPASEEESAEFQRGGWQGRPVNLGGLPRGRGGSLERGGRINRGRGGVGGAYVSYGRPTTYDGGWGNGGDPSEWSPKKEYNQRAISMDNWRRARNNEDDDGWRTSSGSGRGNFEKWGRQTSWRGGEGEEERNGPPERGGRSNWHELNRAGPLARKSWDNEDHLPEWANENPLESGGSFDDRGAFHGSDEEQAEGRGGSSKREGIQKSTSQQHISQKTHPPLHTSKSTMSLVKDIEKNKLEEDDDPRSRNQDPRDTAVSNKERKLSVPEIDKSPREVISNKDRAKSEGPSKRNDGENSSKKSENKVEENDFEKLQEDFVSKLVVDEEPRKPTNQPPPSNFELPGLAPPPNLSVPGQDKWFYQDPQGQMQGPFTNVEMSEWFKAGYFGEDLKVRRQCDERFFLLGELMAMCGSSNPFQTNVRFPVLKNDISKMPDSEQLHFQYMSQMAAYKQAQARVLAEPWSAMAVQQQELVAQRLIMQQQQVQQDLPYMPQGPPTPLMHMLSQMQQQANKIPNPGLIDKQPPNLTGAPMDPHLHMHLTNLLSMQNRLPGPLPTVLAGPIPQPENLAAGLAGVPRNNMGNPGIPLQSGLPVGLGLNVPRPPAVDHSTVQDNNPLSSLLKQLQQNQQHNNHVESLWQNQFVGPKNNTPPQQWPGQGVGEPPVSMWDMQESTNNVPPEQLSPSEEQKQEAEQMKQLEEDKAKKGEKLSREARQKEEEKEMKKRKKAEEEQQKKEADEKRKQEQRKLEAEKKAEAERKRKEDERIKKELEKARKEAEEKRLKEMDEKRKMKEQRKLEEEMRKKTEEERRRVEDERMQREKEQREREERQRTEEKRQENAISMAKAAPWSQTNSTFGMSLAEIQKAERERKAQEALLQAQKAQMEKEIQQQQQQMQEKTGGFQLGWAKRPMEPRKIKSLAAIQAEEQERLAKEVAEARLKKEKESRESAVPLPTANSIWSGQTLTWASASSTTATTTTTNISAQWSSANMGGFWEEPAQKQQQQQQQLNRPSNVSKSNSTPNVNNGSTKQQTQSTKQQPQKSKTKKEEAPNNKKTNHNNNLTDEFTNWCLKALSNIATNVDVPTFVMFLRDIESAYEVREYCKEYLGESNVTQQFANNFLEKRRSFKPKNAHKDDLCSPAPAITPSTHNNSEFQEVKGKAKKTKKSKMLKVDSRILGFNVTSATDRINVGDRDYGDNS